MTPNLDLFLKPIPHSDDNSHNPFVQLINQLTNYEPQTYDPETGFTMTLEQVTVNLPIELNASVNDEDTLTLLSSAPTQTVETTIFPVLHRMTLKIVATDGQ